MEKCLVPLGSRKPKQFNEPIRLAILGSTGSIGKNAIELARCHPNRLKVVALAARSNTELLVQQGKECGARYLACSDESAYAALRDAAPSSCSLSAGEDAVAALAGLPEVDVVLAASLGSRCLASVLNGLRAGKRIALANKESLIAGGALVTEALRNSSGEIVPVDSEHSALFQSLLGVFPGDLEALVLTASGGPFFTRDPRTLRDVTPEEAVRHPRWAMGAKISVDSATLMNKGLELIEAAWLFGVPGSAIETVVHRQSVIHSMVRLTDGSVIAQLGHQDMKGPIGLALTFPGPRLKGAIPHLNVREDFELTFEPLDEVRFPGVRLAREALAAGGGTPAVLNAANEVAVALFLRKSLRFDQIMALNAEALENFGGSTYQSYSDLIALEDRVKTWSEQYTFS